ncbi:hypothetical protein [Pseudolysinimonas yzui]|uniref:Tetratricopeptide repeat protein n=1 Tax=Pseudolysinimonas yzui TaxID=2708254 RepID=A0A8J3GPI2_9MICO|nr:hypothetical protein [Pseudolysinimonas yzui]GHF10832.1 hypothetical protein GCM10011600_09980 [Pseudolysinimonas yzui]
MSDPSSRRPKPRTDRKPPTGKPADRKPYDRKPTDGKPAERKPYDRKPYDRKPADGKPTEGKPYDRKPREGGSADRKPFDRATPGERKPFDRKPFDRASGRPAGGADRRPPRPREDDDRPRHDDPEIPDDVTANLLDKVARAELKTLSKDNADWVARHLVMAGRLIDDDPELAHKHALAAGRRAGRIAVVRESVGITAYALGAFELALRELRTYRRISGRDDQLPLMVDSERGIGRPEKALELGRSVPRTSLDVPVQVALAIAMSGARLDLGQPEAALTELQIPQLDPERAYLWSPALFDAYATVLEDLGRAEEAEQWWQRSDRATIALERAAIPEGEDTVEIIDEDWDPDVAH